MNNHISVRLRENLGEKIDEMMAKYDEILGLEKITNNITDSISILIDKKLDLFSSTVNNK